VRQAGKEWSDVDAILPLIGSALVLSVGAGTASAEEGSCPPGTTEATCAAVVALDDLRGTVEELVQQPGTEHSLIAKLDTATKSVLALRVVPALNELGAFDHEVVAGENAGRLSELTSNLLKARSDTAKNAIQNTR
jgi:hypothetical protein